MKCSHGCRWQFKIKNKEEYISNKRLVDMTRRQMEGWLEQEYWCWQGFEMQYKGIIPKILIEQYMPESYSIQIFCFKGIPKVQTFVLDKDRAVMRIRNDDNTYSYLSEEYIDQIPPDNFINKAEELSKKLSKEFNFVRVDWIVFEEKLYFEELTFTPFSGFSDFGKEWNEKLGGLIEI